MQFLLGVDVYDCILVIRSDVALDSFKTHKATIGTELAVAAGPYGAGAAMEMGIEKAPVFSYTRSRGMYAGVSVVGQIFVARWEENEAMYHWPGVKNGDIVSISLSLLISSLLQLQSQGRTGRGRGAGAADGSSSQARSRSPSKRPSCSPRSKTPSRAARRR